MFEFMLLIRIITALAIAFTAYRIGVQQGQNKSQVSKIRVVENTERQFGEETKYYHAALEHDGVVLDFLFSASQLSQGRNRANKPKNLKDRPKK